MNPALAILDSTELVGLVSGALLSPYEMRTQVFVPIPKWRDKATIRAIKGAFAVLPLTVPTVVKMTALFPFALVEPTALAQRVGFKREGVNKASWPGPDGLVDQVYLGLTVAEACKGAL